MELTERQAVEKSIELWTWLAETGEDKYGWVGWKRNGGKYSDEISGDCFLCEYVDGQEKPRCHLSCPFYLKYRDTCNGEDFPFNKWGSARSNGSRKKYARRFLSQLEEILEDMEEPESQDPLTGLARWIMELINETCDSECSHCNRPLNLPSDEDIEKWLRGEK